MSEALRLTKVAMSAREIAARLEGQLAAQQSLPWWKNSPVDQQRSRAAAGV
jgi:hypothetical protein